MRIIFIQPKAGFMMRGTTYPVCRSIMVSATYMKEQGHEVLVFDRCIDFRNAEKIILGFKPDLSMIYVPPTASVSDAISLSDISRKHGAKVAWGEVVACAVADHVVEKGIADFVITGETEFKLRDLAGELAGDKNYCNIPGITLMKDSAVISTPNVNNTDLCAIPAIDWDLVDVKKCFRQFPYCDKMLYMYTSRGCPFRCTYCYNTMFYNSEHRKRPLDFVLGEIKYLEEKYGLDGANFSDELLLLSDEEIAQIKDFRDKNNLHFFWGGETRADIYDEDALKRMYEAGCRWLLLGIETGSEQTRVRINKPMNQQKIKEFVLQCTNAGIATFGSFIIGFPNETPEQLRETVDFALSLDLDAFLVNFYVLIPKTPLGDETVSTFGLDVSEILNGTSASSQIQMLTSNYSSIPDRDLKVVKGYFDWLTFTRKKEKTGQKNMFMKKAIDVLRHFAEGNVKDSLTNVFSAGKTFVSVLYYSHAYPSINKKYGLHNVNRK